jgi:hypothetical protein
MAQQSNQGTGGDAMFQVYGDLASGGAFLVQNNAGPAYNTGLNTNYTNPGGTAQFLVFNGGAPAVTSASLSPNRVVSPIG